MVDYRLPENRRAYFDKLYALNLNERIMPGLVYMYMPALRHHFGWNAEEALWYAFLNGMTQNPLTSLKLYERLPEPVYDPTFQAWFDENWETLNYDTDRRYQKKDTPKAIQAYVDLVKEFGSQEKFLLNRPFDDVWKTVTQRYASFGRLATWSYLEYVFILAGGEDASNLMLDDKSGSKSHRNGLLFLFGLDNYVWDKRFPNGFDGKYKDFKELCFHLEKRAKEIVQQTPGASLFTLESNCCTFKNHFFGRRYPGVYADMAYDRLKKYEQQTGKDKNTELLWSIREQLPNWLRLEHEHDGLTIKERGSIFVNTGRPYRGNAFL